MQRYWAILELHFQAQDDKEAQEIVEEVINYDFGPRMNERIILFTYEDIVPCDKEEPCGS